MSEATRQCRAKTRAGTPCRRTPMPGRARCNLHGGKSTGPRTPEGLAASSTARLEHGAYAQLSTYQRALAAVHPELYLEAPVTTKLDDEIRFARAQLAGLAEWGVRNGRDVTSATSDLLDRIRLLVAQKHEMFPSAEVAGAFTINLHVVGARQFDETGRPYQNEWIHGKQERVYLDDQEEHDGEAQAHPSLPAGEDPAPPAARGRQAP